MAKKGKAKAATKVVDTSRTDANKLARRARHSKLHPNDKQATRGKLTKRSKPLVKGNAPSANRDKFYRDTVTGQPLGAPVFAPVERTK